MSTADFIATIALITSVVSLTYTFVVNRRRPRLKVYGNIVHVFEHLPTQLKKQGPYFSISATNLGPGRVFVKGLCLTHRGRLKRWYRRVVKRDTVRGFVLDAHHESPDQFPKWLEVGESIELLYSADSGMMDEDDMYDCFYVHDSLGGNHWAPKGVFVAARESLAISDPLDTESRD